MIANAYIPTAAHVLRVHMGILCAGIVLTALLPIYSKLLRRINTSVEVVGNERMAAIDISGEDA